MQTPMCANAQLKVEFRSPVTQANTARVMYREITELLKKSIQYRGSIFSSFCTSVVSTVWPWHPQLRLVDVCPRVTPDKNEILLDQYKKT
jgi:hypothetical protein